MTVKDLIESNEFQLLSGGDLTRKITSVYCCDLLSIVMSKAKADCAWITVMSNLNSIAVASLVDMSCIILADGSVTDENMLNKAKSEGINVLKSALPVFEAATLVEGKRNA